MIRSAGLVLAVFVATAAVAAAQTPPESDEESSAQATPTPLPSPNAVIVHGYVRSFYFARQNASNNPGARFDYTPGAKYNSDAVNQATWNTGVSLDADYKFPGDQWNIGATYFYANPIDGPCVLAANHAKGAVCVTQIPPNTNADDTLPGFSLSTFDEAFLAYKAYGYSGALGYQLFKSPWANPSDSRLKPAAFAGGDLAYSGFSHWTFEAADMLAFENRTSSDFSRQTLLTSYPAGGRGLPDNINAPGGHGIDTNGFAFARAGYANQPSGISADGYFYGISDLVNIWWFDGKYTFKDLRWAPFVALQGGFENNSGVSYLGKIVSQDIGVQIGADLTKNLRLTAGFDSIPWRSNTIFLPTNVTCGSNLQISAKGATLAYFLPMNAGQCFTNKATGLTQIYYGGWATPYTDSYSTDPLFTTSVTQGMADRHAPGTSWKVGLTYTSGDKRFIFMATDAWYDYGNALAPQSTNIWTLDGRYYLSRVGQGRYRGFFLRYRYAQRTQSNTQLLGGSPLFKYNRAQIEYDF
ncbi:MAG TPA: hypothetical protein VFE35_09960 [Candidatus Cybelea sp.]|jgi:hypothetical protein|nr:hypothetical protein [Candidatus Cybelea sp.]